jgi:hypothetical protein
MDKTKAFALGLKPSTTEAAKAPMGRHAKAVAITISKIDKNDQPLPLKTTSPILFIIPPRLTPVLRN